MDALIHVRFGREAAMLNGRVWPVRTRTLKLGGDSAYEQDASMGKTLTIVLAAPPYSGQDAETALKLARAALAKGHTVQLFASADGVHRAQAGQHPTGVPDLPALLATLIERGLLVELCGSCLRLRGLGVEQLVTGTAPSSLKGLFSGIAASDAVLNLGA